MEKDAKVLVLLSKLPQQLPHTYDGFIILSSCVHRLAAMEIARFQDQLVKRINDEISLQNGGGGTHIGPLTGAVTIPQAIQDYEWTFARAFLYSLTVLTTIGKLIFYEINFWGAVFFV